MKVARTTMQFEVARTRPSEETPIQVPAEDDPAELWGQRKVIRYLALSLRQHFQIPFKQQEEVEGSASSAVKRILPMWLLAVAGIQTSAGFARCVFEHFHEIENALFAKKTWRRFF